jgi:hypothetical protein
MDFIIQNQVKTAHICHTQPRTRTGQFGPKTKQRQPQDPIEKLAGLVLQLEHHIHHYQQCIGEIVESKDHAARPIEKKKNSERLLMNAADKLVSGWGHLVHFLSINDQGVDTRKHEVKVIKTARGELIIKLKGESNE